MSVTSIQEWTHEEKTARNIWERRDDLPAEKYHDQIVRHALHLTRFSMLADYCYIGQTSYGTTIWRSGGPTGLCITVDHYLGIDY